MKYLNTKPGSIEEVAASMSKYAAESEYQQMFKKELEKAGKGIGGMTPAEKKAFFNKIDSKYTAKNEEVSQKEIDKFHTSLDKLVHKSFGHSSDEKKKEMKKETHSFVTNKMNQAKKDAPGEKQVVDPEPKLKEPKAKMSFKEAYKKVKEAMNTVGDATADRANQMVGQDDKKKDPDIKKPKATTDAGTKATPIDTSPEVEYKN